MSTHMDRKIKICGLTRECDVDYINEAKPDYIGFVFAESRRKVLPKEAYMLKKRMAEGIRTVGVFVNEQPEKIIALVKEGIIDVVQLHGQETYIYVNYIKEHTKCPIIKAVHQETWQEQDVYHKYAEAGVNYFLFDSSNGEQIGGTGRTFDWSLLPRISYPYFLAGGLHIGNIEAALRKVEPYGVDISSGVEKNGVKDRDKIIEMIRRIRNV